MKITFFYACQCGCTWSTEQSVRNMGFIDSSCNCPSCQEECVADEQELS